MYISVNTDYIASTYYYSIESVPKLLIDGGIDNVCNPVSFSVLQRVKLLTSGDRFDPRVIEWPLPDEMPPKGDLNFKSCFNLFYRKLKSFCQSLITTHGSSSGYSQSIKGRPPLFSDLTIFLAVTGVVCGCDLKTIHTSVQFTLEYPRKLQRFIW